MKRHLIWHIIEALYQLAFYSSPAWFDYPSKVVWIADTFAGGDLGTGMIYTCLIVLATAWTLPSICYGALYYFQIPFFEKYRIQEWVWNRPDSPRKVSYLNVIRKSAETLIFGQLGFMSVVTYYLFEYCLDRTDDLHAYVHNVPHPLYSFGQLMLACIMFETSFYWFHRALHTKYLYKYHKDHHSYYVTMSLAGLWGHTIDGIVSLPIPGILPIFVLDFHFTTLLLWILLNVFHSHYDHSGYDMPFQPFQLIPFSSHCDAHNFHHSHSVDNFGLYFRFWDVIMGTNKTWEAYKVQRDEAIAHLTKEGCKDMEYENFIIKDGVVLVKTVAETRDVKDGTDNLAFTMQNKYGDAKFDTSVLLTGEGLDPVLHKGLNYEKEKAQ